MPLAFAAGLVSFVSPCVLPLVPAYLAYLGANTAQLLGRPASDGPGAVSVATAPSISARGTRLSPVVWSGLAFVAGLSLVFVLFFYVLDTAVAELRVRDYVPMVAGVLVIVMAAQIAGFIRIPFLMGDYRLQEKIPMKQGVFGGFLLGMGFASGWTPCIGPTLGAVLSSAITVGTTSQGLVLMIAYCVGLGLPFVVLAFAIERVGPLVRALNRHRRLIDYVSSAVLLVMGVLLLTGKLTLLSAAFSQVIPVWLQPQL